jgi:uncharacterized membrane protein
VETNNRAHLTEFLENDLILEQHKDEAIQTAAIHAKSSAWPVFLDRLFLILGALGIAFSLLFFIAYNWQEVGRFGKFAIVEAAVIACSLVFLKLKFNGLSSKITLLVTSICVGVLLALFGQTYQTGADPWQLFYNWALLIIPFVVISRFAAHWLLWLALINVSVVLYFETFGRFLWAFHRDQDLVWWMFGFNLIAWGGVEVVGQRLEWLREQWFIRCIALVVGFSATWLAIDAITRSQGLSGFWVWAVWIAGSVYLYQTLRRDLFVLAGCCLSGMCVVLAFLLEFMFDYADAGSLMFFSLSVLAMGSGSAMWLRQVHTKWLTEAQESTHD